LIPIGDTEQDLNWFYQAGSLDTYGLDVGYFITPELNASVGYYYQQGDLGSADGSGVLGRLAYEMTSGVTAGVNISYDEAFETRVSADIKVRFGGASTTAQRKEVQQLPVINALTSTLKNRDVRVHDFKRMGTPHKHQRHCWIDDVIVRDSLRCNRQYAQDEIEKKYNVGDKCTLNSPGAAALESRGVLVFYCRGGVLVPSEA
jgi:hypothetical protein